jgi:hypothetical protein
MGGRTSTNFAPLHHAYDTCPNNTRVQTRALRGVSRLGVGLDLHESRVKLFDVLLDTDLELALRLDLISTNDHAAPSVTADYNDLETTLVALGSAH